MDSAADDALLSLLSADDRPVQAAELPSIVAALEAAVAGGDDDGVAAACRALRRFEPAAGPLATATLLPAVQRGVESASAPVRAVAADVARRAAAASPAAAEAVLAGSLLPALVALLGDDDVAVADAATRALAALAAHPATDVRRVAEALREFASRVGGAAPAAAGAGAPDASIVRARVASAASQLAGASDAACRAVQDAGLLAATLDAVATSDDVLLQLTVMDVLPPLARSGAGWAALEASGAVARVLAWAGVAADAGGAGAPTAAGGDAADALLGDAALGAAAAMYAALATRDPTAAAAWPARPRLLRRVFAVAAAACDGGGTDADAAVRALAALTAVLAADARALDAALAAPALARAWLEGGGANAAEVQAAVLESVAVILDAAPAAAAGAAAAAPAAATAVTTTTAAPPPPPAGDAGYARYVALADALGAACLGPNGGGAAAVALAALRRTVPEVRAAAYHVLGALAGLPVDGGLRRLFGGAGAAAVLLADRDAEPTAAACEWRHAVIAAAARNPLARDVLGADFLAALELERRRGPHWRPGAAAATAVATRT